MDCQFAFGPNGAYFCRSDNLWAWSDNNTLPEPLRRLLEDTNHPQYVKFPYDISFPVEPGLFCMAWQTKQGEIWYEELFLGPKYTKLAEYIKDLSKTGEHTTRTCFGPNASYFSMSPSGFSWQNLPSACEADIIGRFKRGQPSCVALGVNGSFVVLYADGNVSFDGLSYYPAVEGILRNAADCARRKGIAYVALNPHSPNQYYVAFGDGSALWNLPNTFIEDVVTVSRTLRPLVTSSTNIPGVSAASLGTVGVAGTAGLVTSGGSPGGSSGSSAASSAIHGLGKLWDAYQNSQQNNGPSSPYATQTSFFDPTNAGGFNTGGFDPNSVAAGFDPTSVASGFDPSSLVSALDPNSLVVGVVGAMLGN